MATTWGPSLRGRDLSVTGINDSGQIVANAIDTSTGQNHALLLTPR